MITGVSHAGIHVPHGVSIRIPELGETQGKVIVTGGDEGAGIGGGNYGAGGTVAISGMNTVVNATGGHSSKDVGSGHGSSNGGYLWVNGGAVVNLNLSGTNALTIFITCTIDGDGAGPHKGYYLNGIKLDEPPSPGVGRYTVTPVVDSSYQIGTTFDGISTMTVKHGVTGFKYFKVNIT